MISLDSLDALADQARVQKRLAKEKKAGVVLSAPLPQVKISDMPRPDALVLCTIETKCKGCGAVHLHPSKHLLLRHGKNYTALIQSELFYSNVPKEWIIRGEEAEKCRNCWGIGELTRRL